MPGGIASSGRGAEGAARAAVSSGLRGKCEQAVDRESAYELLTKKIAAAPEKT
ncbi:hypothetical protein AB0L88_30940 [Saccharopolyspora shandongensis]|uniref:helicase HerA-like domain-containing protein n=1 Tax=Saccharopolyspora shandongensis TaxID=418495 RepID=UPI00343C5529